MKYTRSEVEAYYDAYGEDEWHRLTKDAAALVSLHVHKHYMSQFVKAGDKILEVGAGAGRFTIELAKLDTRITVGDISTEQLMLNEKYVSEHNYEDFVEARIKLDITDLSMFEAGVFDAVVCYGGPLSYVLDKADTALGEMLRVLKPQGFLLLSVMSLIGTTKAFFDAIPKIPGFPEIVNHINTDGYLDGSTNNNHVMKMYRAGELRSLLLQHDCDIKAISASNYLALNRDDEIMEALVDTPAWQDFLNWELDYCSEEGCLDGGTHVIAVVQKQR